jgi:hypothetical protein
MSESTSREDLKAFSALPWTANQDGEIVQSEADPPEEIQAEEVGDQGQEPVTGS